MRNEASLRRLGELGIDVYLRRGAQPRGVATASAARRSATVSRDVGEGHPGDVVVLARATAKPAQTLVADVMRALRCAGVTCVHADAGDSHVLRRASAMVMLGDAQARAAGATVPAQRQAAIGWVVSADPAALIGDADGKRALWSELRRTVRQLAARGEPARR